MKEIDATFSKKQNLLQPRSQVSLLPVPTEPERSTGRRENLGKRLNLLRQMQQS